MADMHGIMTRLLTIRLAMSKHKGLGWSRSDIDVVRNVETNYMTDVEFLVGEVTRLTIELNEVKADLEAANKVLEER